MLKLASDEAQGCHRIKRRTMQARTENIYYKDENVTAEHHKRRLCDDMLTRAMERYPVGKMLKSEKRKKN